MDFFERTGKMAIGSRLRLLTERITADAARIYEMYGIDMKPKWFPVFFALKEGETKAVTAIAREIGQTHPSVSNILKEMRARGLIADRQNPADKRCNAVALSDEGLRLAGRLETVCDDVERAVDTLAARTRHDLWRAIEEWEYLLGEVSLLDRVKEIRRRREEALVEIVPYRPEHRPAFRRLNAEWITAHWKLESSDLRLLDRPEEEIVGRGGAILVALYDGDPVGVCALLRSHDPHYDFELAKFAVDTRVRGKGIGLMLGRAAVAKAAELGARRLFLESNTLLKPALHIYRKLGFRELETCRPAYSRGDIQMELELSNEIRNE